MSSIYIHIPFCKQRCHYCDFYTTTTLHKRKSYVNRLLQEMDHNRNFLQNKQLRSIYIGGGTPSVLSVGQLETIMERINALYHVQENAEITIEINPDDIDYAYLVALKKAGFNRLSMGVQSFKPALLQLMGRRHDNMQAVNAVKSAFSAGFNNISIDLIYGLPGQTIKNWQEDLAIAADLPVKHISAYHLTYEKGTNFYKWLRTGSIKQVTEDTSVNFYDMLVNWAFRQGFIHYEISNFARPGFYSRHNFNYWQMQEYLGLGPSAHSFRPPVRAWNKPNLHAYLTNKTFESIQEKEHLSARDLFNDYMITALRTNQGINFGYVEHHFGEQYLTYLRDFLERTNFRSGLVQLTIDGFHLTEQGFLFSDGIFQDLLMLKA